MWWSLLLESSCVFWWGWDYIADLHVLVPVLQFIHGFVLHIPETVCQWANRKDLSKSFPNKGNIQLFLSWSVWFCAVLGRAGSEQTGSPDASCKEWQPSALSLGWSYCNTSAPTLLLLSLRHQYLNCNFSTLLICQGRFSIKMALSHITDTPSVLFPAERWPA